jgi:hypothetical protein
VLLKLKASEFINSESEVEKQIKFKKKYDKRELLDKYIAHVRRKTRGKQDDNLLKVLGF